MGEKTKAEGGYWRGRYEKRVTSWLLTCGIIALPCIAAFIVAATVLAPGYCHLTETVSRLGGAEMSHAHVMNVGLVSFGLLMMGFGWGLYRFLRGKKGALRTGMLVSIFGLGILVAGIFPIDHRDANEPTTTGLVHAAGAGVAYVAMVLATFSLARFVNGDKNWRWFAKLSVGVVLVSLALAITFTLDSSEPVRGLLQRFFYGLPIIWMQFVALRILWLGRAENMG